MAFRIEFKDLYFPKTFDVTKTNLDGKECIEITCYDEEREIEHSIWLDKSTAIKFAKTIRTEINKIEEGSNG